VGSGKISLVGGRDKNNKNADIRYFRTTGRKQHNFPEGYPYFRIDGI
jgi:hypothetical protein